MWNWLLAAPIVSAAGTWLARGYALRRQLVDEPGERRSHAVATPRGGGIGPVLAILAVIVGLGATGALHGVSWPWLASGLAMVAAIGAWDDHRPLGVGLRLGIHLLAGVAMALAFGLQHDLAMAALVVGAVVVAVNVWNFMDGINGIASTQAVIVAAAAAWIAEGGAVPLAMAAGLAVLAFVPFNFPRARIFMGDVGSGALGYVVVMLALGASGRGVSDSMLLLFPTAAFLVDASLTLGRRIVEGERWWTAHTRHLYQACARRVGHTRVTLAYATWSLVGAVLAVSFAGASPRVIVVSLVVWYTSAAGVWAYLQHRARRWSAAA